MITDSYGRANPPEKNIQRNLYVRNRAKSSVFGPTAVTNGQSAADFRVQKYHNRPVLTWAQEKGFGGLAHNESVDYIWNGATDVFLWDVLDASGEVANRDLYDGERSDRDRDDKRRITSTNWNSLDTTIAVDKISHLCPSHCQGPVRPRHLPVEYVRLAIELLRPI